MNLLHGIKNIIFDFGGVVINIDYQKTRDAFMSSGIENFDQVYSQAKQNPIFDLFETGKIHEEDFFSELERLAPSGIQRDKIKSAWNAMLLDFPEENLQFLKKIKNSYRTFLLSNTNEAHLKYYFGKVKDWYGIDNMDPLFEKAMYSCRLGYRKPHAEIFELVLKENRLDPSETLFIDDSLQHVEGAKKCGIRAHHLQKKENIITLLNIN